MNLFKPKTFNNLQAKKGLSVKKNIDQGERSLDRIAAVMPVTYFFSQEPIFSANNKKP